MGRSRRAQPVRRNGTMGATGASCSAGRAGRAGRPAGAGAPSGPGSSRSTRRDRPASRPARDLDGDPTALQVPGSLAQTRATRRRPPAGPDRPAPAGPAGRATPPRRPPTTTSTATTFACPRLEPPGLDRRGHPLQPADDHVERVDQRSVHRGPPGLRRRTHHDQSFHGQTRLGRPPPTPDPRCRHRPPTNLPGWVPPPPPGPARWHPSDRRPAPGCPAATTRRQQLLERRQHRQNPLIGGADGRVRSTSVRRRASVATGSSCERCDRQPARPCRQYRTTCSRLASGSAASGQPSSSREAKSSGEGTGTPGR